MTEKEKSFSQMILNYLQRNPEAGDTLEGIVTWWLEQERIERAVDEVAKVLESLVQKGAVRVHKTQNGTSIYKINK